MNLTGQPTSKSSTYESNLAQNFAPKYALPGASSAANYFRSVRELYPWLVIDYQTARTFANVG